MARGDRNALGQLFERHASRLLPIGAAILRDDSEAEDVLHDVFLEAFRRARAFDAERGSVVAWLAVRMRSRSLDRKKSATARRTVSSEETPASEALTEDPDVGARVLERHKLASAIRELPPDHAEVLMLGYFEDLSCSEIAARLEIPIGTVKSRVRRALQVLREKLAGGTGGPS